MSERLLQLEKDLRSAVARRSYSEVQTLAAQIGAQAAEEWRTFPRGDPRARRIFDRLLELLEWARRMVCVSRASAADDLRRTVLANRYRAAPSAIGSRLRFDM
jgi:hypothetical protein